ncbi:MAG: hypothetical protein AAGI91_10950 [Bacteroidota bacterium]
MRTSLTQIRQKYAALQTERVARRRAFDPEEALLIFSDPRGGSTWIAEVLHHIPRTAVVWEPLHVREVPAFREIGFKWRQYIPEDAAWEAARETFDRLFRGALLNRWTCRVSDWRAITRAERLLVKFVRGNALLPWLTGQFAFRRPPVLLVRHPFAVVASQMLYFSFEKQKTPPSQWRGFGRPPTGRFNDLFHEHAAYLKTLETLDEVLLAQWCLTTLPTLRHPANNERWLTVHYETMLLEPEAVVERIFAAWDFPVPPGVVAQLSQASSTTNKATFQQGAEAQLAKWQRQFDPEQIRRMRAVLDYFEVEVYDEGLMPRLPPGVPTA